ncbi:MAG TPA: CHAT domain-containing protein, partial [Kofleriaceae bacterium]
DLSQIITFVARAALADKIANAVGEQLVAAARAMLIGGLKPEVDVQLALRAADLYVTLGKREDALAVIAEARKRTTAPKLIALLDTARGRLRPPPPPTSGPARSALVPPSVRAALGNSLLWEDLRGDFTRALAEAKDDLIARACVLSTSGQARAASRLLAPLLGAGDTPPQDAVLLSHAYRYAQRVDFQYVVGGAPYGDVYLTKAVSGLSTFNTRPDDATARADCEALVGFTNVLATRAAISFAGARYDEATQNAIRGLSSTLDGEASTQVRSSARSPAWLPLAAADLHRRNNDDTTHQFIELARTAAASDPHAVGEIALVEGHWAVCSVESPLTLGLCLEGSPNPDSSLDDRVEQREYEPVSEVEVANAMAAYARAEAAFRDATSPRGLATVTLARAGVAALARDHVRAAALARDAERCFAAVGDELGRRLARTHAAIALTATGGPIDHYAIREIGTWCVTDGSLAFGLGCARLLSRSGRRALYLEGNIERALARHRLAFELLSAASCDLLATQALVDQANAFRLANDLNSVAETLEHASVQLEHAKDAGAAELAPRRAWLVQQAWALENQRASSAGLDRVAMRMSNVIAQLDAALQTEATHELLLTKLMLSRVALTSPVLSSLYRARDLESDPDSSAEQRLRACQDTIALARNLDPSEALRYEGLALALHGDDQGGSDAFQQLYGGPDPTQAVPGAATLPIAETIKLRRLKDALTSFLRVRDVARARAAYDQLIALDPKWATLDEQPWNGLADAAALLSAEGNRSGALALFDQAIAEVEERRSLLTADVLKRGFVDTSPIHAMYVGAARACIDDRPRAFSFVERGRARALLDLALDRRAGSSPWRAYNAKRDRLHSLLATERAKAVTAPFRIADLESELAKLVPPSTPERLIDDPRAAIATLDNVAAGLPDDTLLIEFAFADDFMIAWAISRAGMKQVSATPIRTSELRRTALGFRIACAVGAEVDDAGSALAKLLLEPFADAIRGAKHVVIVPSDSLYVVPFHALPFDNRHLIDAVAVSYSPSASLALELGRGAIAGGALLAIGNPSDMAISDDIGTRALAQLPGAAVEVRRIVATHPGARGLVGADATLEAVSKALPAA